MQSFQRIQGRDIHGREGAPQFNKKEQQQAPRRSTAQDQASQIHRTQETQAPRTDQTRIQESKEVLEDTGTEAKKKQEIKMELTWM